MGGLQFVPKFGQLVNQTFLFCVLSFGSFISCAVLKVAVVIIATHQHSLIQKKTLTLRQICQGFRFNAWHI